MQLKTKTQTLVMTAMMAALLAVLSPFTLPLGPVPFTLALFAVFLTGALLPPLPAVAAVAVYTLLGLAGMPVFSGFRAGPQVLLGPTGGYLAGYFLIALATALAVRRTTNYAIRLAAALGGLAACYLLGTLWYVVSTGAGFLSGLMVCVAPFALWDALKAVLALVLARALERRMAGMAQ
ncbi:biotin transporter BioY [Ruminococcaceae bacterium OttesenSCG-928-D13]|nr:biotin transporter BioY [Ruminococcaceae bacterium OttesenSCG-928-D13]